VENFRRKFSGVVGVVGVENFRRKFSGVVVVVVVVCLLKLNRPIGYA
jgi:hypothetical protein